MALETMVHETPSAKASTVLVVDDDSAISQLLSAIVEEHGCVTFSASSGAEAAAILAVEHIDLVVTDLSMPDLPEESLASFVKREYGLPVILITGYNETEVDATTRQHADAILRKPLGISRVVGVIDELLPDRLHKSA